MAIIQVIQWDDNLNSNDVLAWRYVNKNNAAKSDEIGNWSQLVVRESQEAILFRDGQAVDLYGPGRHTLSTDNLPFLRTIMNLPTGGESPYKAGIWFVNKVNLLDMKWGTQNPLLLKDPEYQIPIYVRAFGQFGLQIAESRQFVIKLAGNKTTITRSDLENYFRGLILSRMGDMIATYIARKKINIFEINSYLDDMSDEAIEKLRPTFQNFGIEPSNFFFGSVNVVDDDEGIKKLKAALSERATMNVMGYNYQQKRSFDVLESAAKNEGGGSLIGAGTGLGAGMGIGGALGQMAAQMGQYMNPQTQTQQPVQPQNIPVQNPAPAPKISVPVTEPAQEPVAKLENCPHCGKPLVAGAVFCPYCGKKPVCTECGAALIPGAKFCPQCGKPV